MIVAVVWFISQLYYRFQSADFLSLKNFASIVMSVMLYLITALMLVVGWDRILIGIGQPTYSLLKTGYIVLSSQIGKYVPGNVAHHVGRLVLAKRQGWETNAILFSMLIETLWMVAIASIMALIALWSVGSRVFGGLPQIPDWWVLAGLVGVAMLAPIVGHRLFDRAAHWWAARKDIAFQSVHMPPARTFWLISLLYVINYLVLGLVLQIIATQVFGAEHGDILLLTGIFAVAWVVGFITPGAPAGFGVREVILVAALTPVYGHETAIGIAAVLRVVTLLGDGLAFLIGLTLERALEKRPHGI